MARLLNPLSRPYGPDPGRCYRGSLKAGRRPRSIQRPGDRMWAQTDDVCPWEGQPPQNNKWDCTHKNASDGGESGFKSCIGLRVGQVISSFLVGS